MGSWILQDNPSCDTGLTIDIDGAYTFGTACVLDDLSVGVSRQTGTAITAGGIVAFSEDETTCADDKTPWQVNFSVTPAQLSLTFSNAVLVFQRNVSAGNGAGAFGCFRSGVFTPSPLARI